MVNNCLFLDNAAVATDEDSGAFGGAILAEGELSERPGQLTVVDSIFKKNKAIQVDTTERGGGGAIDALDADVLVLSSVFELNEASSFGGAALIRSSSVAWYNNKELLFGNDDGIDCGGVAVGLPSPTCFGVEDNFSV